MSGTLDRRGLFRVSAAAAALALGAGPLAGTTARAAGAPVRGGHFRAGISGGHTGDSFDPITYSDLFMTILGAGAIYSRLTEVDADGKVTGALAESWETSADAAVWTFRLCKGVEFHNGRPFTAEDVIASVRRLRGCRPDLGAEVAFGGFSRGPDGTPALPRGLAVATGPR